MADEHVNLTSDTYMLIARAKSGEYPLCGEYAGQQVGTCILPKGHSDYCFAEY